MALFFEIYEGLARQGPGDAASTRRALAAIPGLRPETRILDLGCGTGAQTIVLAQHSPAHIVAIDTHPPFVAGLQRRTDALGLGGRVEARAGDMAAPDVASGSFDVIWCEGAIYNIGFEEGLRRWRPLLRPGGHLAVSEVCWAKPDPPPACAEFWAREYPAIRTVPELLAAIDGCGYDTLTHFPVPDSAWWEEYYQPLQERVTAFRARHPGDPDAESVADAIQGEIDIWRAHGRYYSYSFFVLRAR